MVALLLDLYYPQAALEAATPFPSILFGGSLILIVVYWDGDGFSLAKYVPCFRRDDIANRSL